MHYPRDRNKLKTSALPLTVALINAIIKYDRDER